MRKQLVIIALVVLLTVVVCLCGCNEEEKDPKNSIVGAWKTGVVTNVGYTILEFKSDGTAEDKMENGDISATGTWELNGDILTLNLKDKSNNDWSFVFKIHFENNGKLLIAKELSSGNTETWNHVAASRETCCKLPETCKGGSFRGRNRSVPRTECENLGSRISL